MILVQRAFHVAPGSREAFEQRSRDGLWPAFLHFGAQMVAFGSWGFGGPGDVLVTNTAYENFDHWAATQQGSGAYYHAPAVLDEIKELLPIYEGRDALVDASEARVFEIDQAISRPRAFRRRPGQRLADLPPSFGRGSVVSERTLAIDEGMKSEFRRLSGEVIWPWLESQGGRAVGMGGDLMGASNELTTWFAFTSLSEWYKFARPDTAQAPPHVAEAYTARDKLVRHQRGRLLIIGTDWGARGK